MIQTGETAAVYKLGHVDMSPVCVCPPSLQYLTMVELLESIDYMVKNAPYRKFRPNVPIHNNAKVWSV